MKPDQHKKKRSAQYKRKHGKTDKKEASKDTNAAKVTAPHVPKSGCSKSEISENAGSLPPKFAQTKDLAQGQDEAEEVRIFSRRKIESNWSRYDNDLLGDNGEDVIHAGLKGADYTTLLSQSGDVSSQFRFKDEQIWEEEETDTSTQQGLDEGIPALDCHCLSQQLRTIPLPVRLSIDPCFFEVSALQSMEEAASRQLAAWNGARHQERPTSGDGSFKPCPTPTQQIFRASGGEPTDEGVSVAERQEVEAEGEEAEETREDIQLLSPHAGDDEDIPPAAKSKDARSASATLPEVDARPQDPSGLPVDIWAVNPRQRRTYDEGRELSPTPPDGATDAPVEAADGQGDTSLPNDPPRFEAGGRTVEPVHVQSDSISSESHLGVTQVRSDPPLRLGSCQASQASTQLVKGRSPRPIGRGTPAAVAKASPPPMAEDGEDEELDFLLSLESPVQTRGALISNGSCAGGDQEDEGASQQEQEADLEPKPNSVPTPSTSRAVSDSLEDWLDSVL